MSYERACACSELTLCHQQLLLKCVTADFVAMRVITRKRKVTSQSVESSRRRKFIGRLGCTFVFEGRSNLCTDSAVAAHINMRMRYSPPVYCTVKDSLCLRVLYCYAV